MPIQEPQSPLWAVVKPQVAGALGGSGWVDTDEDAVRDLATQWTNAGAVFGSAMSGNQRPPGFVGPVANEGAAWPDDAGMTWTTRRLGLGADLTKQGTEMQTLAAHATAFADDVTHTKEQIVQTIQANAAAFDELAALPDGAGAAAQETFAAEVARAIIAFAEQMAANVAGRQPGIAPQAERPTVAVDAEALDGYGMEEAADDAGRIAALASAAALGTAVVFPPAAVALSAVALVAGGFALFQHGREAVETFQDPEATTEDKIDAAVTVAIDGVGLVPGVRGLGGGTQGLVDAFGATAPAWTRWAEGLGAGAHAPEIGGVAQSASQSLPQLASESDNQSVQDAGTAGYGAGRLVDLLPGG